jgi:hypothetical protein
MHKGILRKNGKMVLFRQEPFTTLLTKQSRAFLLSCKIAALSLFGAMELLRAYFDIVTDAIRSKTQEM